MRVNDNQSNKYNNGLLNVDFHRFIELSSGSNSLEIAEELGISLHDVKKLKRKLNRS